jgi:hypothetical protein
MALYRAKSGGRNCLQQVAAEAVEAESDSANDEESAYQSAYTR